MNIKLTLYVLLAVALTFAHAASAGEPVWDGNMVVVTSEKLDGGVYTYYSTEAKAKEVKGLPVATSGGFVVGDKGVLMIDTMLNKRLYAITRFSMKRCCTTAGLFCSSATHTARMYARPRSLY